MKGLAPGIALVVVVGLLAVPGIRALSDPVPMELLSRLRKGMTRAEVQSILGPPAKMFDSGQWTYQRPLVFGFVNIHWQEDGTYDGDFNYERF